MSMSHSDVREEIREAVSYAESQLCGRNGSWYGFGDRVAELESLVESLRLRVAALEKRNVA